MHTHSGPRGHSGGCCVGCEAEGSGQGDQVGQPRPPGLPVLPHSSGKPVDLMLGEPERRPQPLSWEEAFGLYNPGQNMSPLSQAQTVHTPSRWKSLSHHRIPIRLFSLPRPQYPTGAMVKVGKGKTRVGTRLGCNSEVLSISTSSCPRIRPLGKMWTKYTDMERPGMCAGKGTQACFLLGVKGRILSGKDMGL